MNTQGYQYGSISTLAWLPVGVSTASIKQVSDKYYGNLIRSSDSPNNVQQFHSIEVVTDTRNVLNCIPALGAGDGGGASGSNYILTEYNSEPMKGLLAKVTLVYSIFSEYAPNATGAEQSSTKQVPITEWSKSGTSFHDIGGDGTTPKNNAIFTTVDYDTSASIASSTFKSFGGFTPTPDPANTGSCAYYTSQSLFQTWGSGSAYIGNDQFEIPTISYTYSEYSTSEFSSDADLLATVQTPTGAPTLASGGNWLLMGSNRSKTGYFYTKSDTYLSNVPGWNSTIYA